MTSSRRLARSRFIAVLSARAQADDLAGASSLKYGRPGARNHTSQKSKDRNDTPGQDANDIPATKHREGEAIPKGVNGEGRQFLDFNMAIGAGINVLVFRGG